MFNYKKLAIRIKTNEGFRNKSYLDSLGNNTVGYGHLIKKSEKHLLHIRLSKKTLTKIFKKDLERAIVDYGKIYKKQKFSKKTQEVLIEMIFQLGLKGVLGFKKFNKHLLKKNNFLAALEMIDSKWYKQTPLRVTKLVSLLIYKND